MNERGGAPAATANAFELRPAQAPGPSGRGVAARLALTCWAAAANVLALRSGWDEFAIAFSELTKSFRFALTWTALVVGASPVSVWCSASDRVCRLIAGPAMAANTQPQTSRASARVPPAAKPTVRFSPGISRTRRPSLPPALTSPPRRAVPRRRPAAGRW